GGRAHPVRHLRRHRPDERLVVDESIQHQEADLASRAEPERPDDQGERPGNPVEIAAVVVWKVRDSAMASFDVEDFESFVAVQSETAVRHLATEYPYDAEGEDISLRGSTDRVSATLKAELQQ